MRSFVKDLAESLSVLEESEQAPSEGWGILRNVVVNFDELRGRIEDGEIDREEIIHSIEDILVDVETDMEGLLQSRPE